MKKTHNRMTVGKLSFRPFNNLQLENIYVEDLKGDTLFHAKEVSASFNLFRLLNNCLFLQSAEVNDFVVRVNQDSIGSDFNFQFFIDAFQSEEPDSASSNLIIQISDVVLKNGRLDYDVLSSPENERFDPHHIHLVDFQTIIHLRSIDIKALDVAIEQFSFAEKSGWTVTNLQTRVHSKDEKIELDGLSLRFPHSEIAVSNAWVDYTGYEIGELLNKGNYSFQLGNNDVAPEDIKMFYPKEMEWNDHLTFTGSGKGTFPRITLSQLKVDYGEHTGLELHASMNDYADWKKTPIQLNLKSLFADWKGVKLNLAGTVIGVLPELKINLRAQTDRGDLHLNGTAGYDYDYRRTHFDAQLNAEQVDLRTLLQDTIFGYASLQLKAKGAINSSGAMDVVGNATIDRFDFNDYSYHAIQADVAYRGDSLRLRVNSEDVNVPVKIRGMVSTKNNHSFAKLYIRMDSVFLDPLHLLPNYKDAYLSSAIKTDVKGFDIENMELRLNIDSFYLHTDKGSFKDSFRVNYQASDSCKKQLTIASHIFNAQMDGRFSYVGIKESLVETFPMLFPLAQPSLKKKDAFPDAINFRMAVNNANSLSGILDLPEAVPDSALFIGKYRDDGEIINLSASAFTQFLDADTLQLSISLSNKGTNLAFIFNVDNKSTLYNFDGSIDAEVEFVPKEGRGSPDMKIALNPTVFVLNETYFDLQPAQIEIRDKQYHIHNLLFDHNTTEYIKMDGVISELPDDSIKVTVSKFRLGTIFNAMKSDIPLSGEASGEIVAKRLLSTPFILSRGFSVNDIVFAGNAVGNLRVTSAWNSERQGLGLRATLSHEDHPQSVITGFLSPERDTLALTANIRDMELQWLKDFTIGTLYGLDGSMNANLKISGKITEPLVSGTAYFDQAAVGIVPLNTMYYINDSIYLNTNFIELKQFTVRDEKDHTLTATGKITHKQFADLNPDISLSATDFLVLNNAKQTDSLFYGNLGINGSLKIKKSNKDWLVSGSITNSKKSGIMVNIPSSASTAARHSSITFINTEEAAEEAKTSAQRKKQDVQKEFTFPLKIDISIGLDPGLTMGAVFNQATGDMAEVTGNGSMKFVYDLKQSDMSLYGGYEIESGKATLSLKNVTKKTFTVQEGGKLTFKGDPLATAFDLTALYNLRTDLTTLDPSLQDIGLSAKVPVTCSLTAVGNMDKMELKYDILLPNEPDDVQRKVKSLLYTDDLKIKEIAYLLALGSFMPLTSNDSKPSGDSFWTSLASSSITNQLNNLLSGVLNENWSIGTDLRTSDTGFSDVDMDVNISTQLFNNRLTVNSTLGYHNDPSQTDNFTGDFDIEYKLIPSGNVLLKVYNETNNQYYEKAKTTQGIGIVYKREAKTFKRLFDKFRRKK